MKQILKAVEDLAVSILTGKSKLSDVERKTLFDPNDRLGKMSEEEARTALQGWLGNLSPTTKKKILKKMD